MEEFEVNNVNAGLMNEAYRSQQELVSETCASIDYHLYVYYSHHRWLGPDNDLRNMLGLMVTREEFEHNLSGSSIRSLYEVATEEEAESLKAGVEVCMSRLKKTDRNAFPAMQILNRFHLSDFEWFSFMLTYATQVDDRYEKMVAYLQDDVTKKRPSPMLCIRLFVDGEVNPEGYLWRFSPGTVFGSLFDPEAPEGQLRLKQEVLDFMCGNLPQLKNGVSLFKGPAEAPMQTGFDTANLLDNAMQTGEQRVILLSGPAGCGKKFQIRHLCSRRGASCLFADMEMLEYKPEVIPEMTFLARLFDSYLCLFHLDSADDEGKSVPASSKLVDAIRRIPPEKDAFFLLSREPIHMDSEILSIDVIMEKCSESDRTELFTSCLDAVEHTEDVDPCELASKFSFEPKQITGACYQAAGIAAIQKAPVDAELIHRCCYRQVVSKLSDLASQVKPNFTWDDVVMPEQQKRLLQHACSYVKYKHKVYQDWGFDKRISYGRGLSVLFAGVPGTGKTMSAQVMAKQLNMQMYKINISQIVSKYIGETEKNLQAVFTEARKANCILFFDECDALFGKRSDVKDAHDRNANVEVAYLLQQIEEHDGVCVLATNLLQNIDEAFMRRITYVVRFPFPDAKARKEIYLRTFPEKTPMEPDIDWDFIAEKFALSGGHIKNIVLSAAFSAAAENKPVSMRHVLNAAVGEMKKNDIVVVREELREYADLLDQ